MQLSRGVSAGVAGEHQPPQQGQSTRHLLLTHPVLHQTQVGVVGGQQPQQGGVQPCGWRRRGEAVGYFCGGDLWEPVEGELAVSFTNRDDNPQSSLLESRVV